MIRLLAKLSATLTPEHARRLGAYAAALTIEGIARRHGTYGEEPFAEDILNRARRLNATAAREYRRADRPRVRSEALRMLEEPHRMQLVAAMMRRLLNRLTP
ncbi:MAG TPA: hypothetical protein VJ836_05790 [Candidatus Saccharimonadales bacterium]|nr:hypothetical protein [Candidatus Saccharimonadales bacterium]